MNLELSCFHLADNTFYQFVLILGTVFLLEAGTEGPGEDLIEGCLGGTEECLHYLVGGLVAFPIHKLDEQFALGIGELFHFGLVGFVNIVFHSLDECVLLLLGGQPVQSLARLLDEAVHLLRDGQHLLHVIDEAVVGAPLLLALELQRRTDPQLRQEVAPHRVALLHQRLRIAIDLQLELVAGWFLQLHLVLFLSIDIPTLKQSQDEHYLTN